MVAKEVEGEGHGGGADWPPTMARLIGRLKQQALDTTLQQQAIFCPSLVNSSPMPLRAQCCDDPFR